MVEKNYHSHNSFNGESAGVRVKRYYPWKRFGENIARGQSTPDQVFASWMKSPGHRDNILDSSFDEVRFGMAGSGRKLWTTDLGRR